MAGDKRAIVLKKLKPQQWPEFDMPTVILRTIREAITNVMNCI